MVLKSYCKNLKIDEAFVSEAYENWRHNEAGRKNHWRVDKYHGGKESLVKEIVFEIKVRILAFDPIKTKPCNDSRKTRDIGIEPVKQQICGYVVDLAIEQLWGGRVGYWQISRPGFGQFDAAPTVQRWLISCLYHVHLDIEKCYDNIKCQSVHDILCRYIRCPDVIYIADTIMQSYPDGHLMIGSYYSLRMAMLVLSFGYHHVESIAKQSEFHQCWYVDDIWLMSSDKEDLKRVINSLSCYLDSNFGLHLKPWKICQSNEMEPADIAGVTITPNKITIRDETFLKARRAVIRYQKQQTNQHLARRLLSYNGWLKNTDCSKFMKDNDVHRLITRAKKLVSANDRRSKCQ